MIPVMQVEFANKWKLRKMQKRPSCCLHNFKQHVGVAKPGSNPMADIFAKERTYLEIIVKQYGLL